MAELQHKTPRKPRRTNLRRLPGWHRTGEIFYAVGFLTEYWLICLGRKAAAAAHAARDAALYLIWLLLAPVLELGQAFCTALAGPHPLRQLVPWLAPCAAGVILWAVVAHGLNLHFTLQVEVNGAVVGSVATEQNFDTARADLQARLAAARQLADSSDTAALPVLEPTYTLHIGGTPMTELQLTDAILRASGSSIVEGTAVYLDGSLAFVTVEGDHLRCFFNQLQRPWRAPRQSNVRTAFLHELRLVDGIYLAGSVQPYGEIVQQLQSRDLLQVKTVYTRVYQEPIPYDQQTVDFLWGIRFNNDRSWFQEHKEQYQTHLLAPTRALGEQLYDGLHAMLPHEPLILKVSRIYRDARRLHGQGPYKDHLWLCVRTGDQDWTGRPTFYFEIAPDYYSYGMGFWCAAPALMALYRQRIDADPKPLEKLVRRFDRQQTFRLTGPEYARSKGQVSDLLRPWYQKKSLSLQCEAPLDQRIFSPQLPQEILESFRELLPFYRYFTDLCAALSRQEGADE